MQHLNEDRITLIRKRLVKALEPKTLDIEDQSHLHRGHPGAANGGGHFSVTIKAEAFVGKNEIERHRMVYAALEDLIPHEIHALAIKTQTPP